MRQVDFFASQPDSRPEFRDIRNTRPSSAEEKAILLLRLGELIRRVPPSVANGSINKTRQWLSIQRRATQVAASTRSSAMEISSAIQDLSAYL